MAVININGGQINIAGGNSEITATQTNFGRGGSIKTQVNVISGNGKIRSSQVNTDSRTYNSTSYETDNQ